MSSKCLKTLILISDPTGGQPIGGGSEGRAFLFVFVSSFLLRARTEEEDGGGRPVEGSSLPFYPFRPPARR